MIEICKFKAITVIWHDVWSTQKCWVVIDSQKSNQSLLIWFGFSDVIYTSVLKNRTGSSNSLFVMSRFCVNWRPSWKDHPKLDGRRWLQFPNNRCSIQSYFADLWKLRIGWKVPQIESFVPRPLVPSSLPVNCQVNTILVYRWTKSISCRQCIAYIHSKP